MSTINEAIKQLEAKRASAEKEIAALTAAINALTSLGGTAAPVAAVPAPAKKRTMSASARAKIRAAQKARWAVLKSGKAKAAKPKAVKAVKAVKAAKPAKKKPVISAAGIEKIRAAQKARWAKIKAEKAAPAAA